MKNKTTTEVRIETDTDYASFERLVAKRGAAVEGPLFTTNAEDLWEAYLGGIPEAQRQHYNCRCCQRFIERYGGLVTIDEQGNMVPVFWPKGLENVPIFFEKAAYWLCSHVMKARINDVFLSSELVWGTPQTGLWTHLSCTNKNAVSERIKTAAQVMAEKKEEHGMLCRGLAEYQLEAVVQAVRVLEADAVERPEKALGVAKWLLDLHQRLAGKRNPRRDNLVWLAVATAPPGWCHVKTTMIGTLLDDVVQGLPYESIRRRWAEKMHPLQYLRPTAAPKEGAIKQANELVAKLGAQGSLARRFAKLTDVTHFVWKPAVMEWRVATDNGTILVAAPSLEEAEKLAAVDGHLLLPRQTEGGAFDHLLKKTKQIKEVQLPPARIVWERFEAMVLPGCRQLECYVAPMRQPFYGLVAPVNKEAPPLLQWANGLSWYFYHGGSYAVHWHMDVGTWALVTAVFRKPCHWENELAHQGDGILFALQGCWDTQHKEGGGFFPESLRAEYHGMRAVLEAHANGATIAGREEGDANGLCLDRGHPLSVRADGREYLVER